MSKKIQGEEIICPKCSTPNAPQIGRNSKNDKVYKCCCGCRFAVTVVEIIEEVYLQN